MVVDTIGRDKKSLDADSATPACGLPDICRRLFLRRRILWSVVAMHFGVLDGVTRHDSSVRAEDMLRVRHGSRDGV
jgi:hypothetical protein